MTYYINVDQSKEEDFKALIKSLKKMGVIESFESSESLATEGDPVSTSLLLEVLAKSKKELSEGKSFTNEEARKKLVDWKKK